MWRTRTASLRELIAYTLAMHVAMSFVCYYIWHWPTEGSGQHCVRVPGKNGTDACYLCEGAASGRRLATLDGVPAPQAVCQAAVCTGQCTRSPGPQPALNGGTTSTSTAEAMEGTFAVYPGMRPMPRGMQREREAMLRRMLRTVDPDPAAADGVRAFTRVAMADIHLTCAAADACAGLRERTGPFAIVTT